MKQLVLLHAGEIDFTKGRWYPVTSGMIRFSTEKELIYASTSNSSHFPAQYGLEHLRPDNLIAQPIGTRHSIQQ